MKTEKYGALIGGAMKLAANIHDETKMFIDSRYPELHDKDRIIATSILSCRIFESVWGAAFHAENASQMKNGMNQTLDRVFQMMKG